MYLSYNKKAICYKLIFYIYFCLNPNIYRFIETSGVNFQFLWILHGSISFHKNQQYVKIHVDSGIANLFRANQWGISMDLYFFKR